jgi:dipeptidyl aminopeptidase/acylaminoacyl peptidase
VIYGKSDSVVPTEQSEKMAAALKKAGKTYQLIALEGEDHWLSRAKTRVEMLKAIAEFLSAHNPP